jgi:hypothetical protein
MSAILVVYQNVDAAWGGRLADHVRRRTADSDGYSVVDFGSSPEAASRNVIDRALVVIGPGWMADRNGTRLMDDPNDPVRVEIERLRAERVLLQPVFVGGVAAADLADLPESLQKLCSAAAAQLSDEHFGADIDKNFSFLLPERSYGDLRERLLERAPAFWFVVGCAVGIILTPFALLCGRNAYRLRKKALEKGQLRDQVLASLGFAGALLCSGLSVFWWISVFT